MVNSQLLPTVKPQVRAHMPTAANEPQPCGTDSVPTRASCSVELVLDAWTAIARFAPSARATDHGRSPIKLQ